MRIAIVCGHFIPEMGYVEVYLAKELAKIGHEVKVFTTHLTPKYVKKITSKKYRLGEEEHPEFKYKILRLPPFFVLGQMVITAHLKKHVDQFDPKLVLVIGVGKIFPSPIFSKKHKSYKVFTLLGNSSDNQKAYVTKFNVATIREIIKRPAYKKAIEYSDKLFPYTPETIDLVKDIIPITLYGKLEEKSTPISLGFDTDKFYFSKKERDRGREKLGVPNNVPLLITATRIVSYKRLEEMIDLVDEMNKNGKRLYYIIVGFLDDEYAKEVKEYINAKEFSNRFFCYPFLSNVETRELYATADIAFFPTAVISIFEAMGTGLLMILPSKTNVTHILDENISGFYIKNQTISKIFSMAYEHVNSSSFDREKLVLKNQQNFSYKSIVSKIMDELVS